MRKWLLRGIAVVVFLAIGASLTASWGWQKLSAPLTLPEEGLLFDVKPGAPLAQVTTSLEALGVLEYPRIIDWYARWQGSATGIQAGEYQLEPGLNSILLIEMLSRGNVYLHQFTIIEGWRFDEMLARLREHAGIVSTDQSGPEVMAGLGKPDLHPEGQFLPDTYSFPRGTRDAELLTWAHEALWSLVDESWNDRPAESRLQDPYDGLILASIIEKETALDSERNLISGVVHERLRRDMRLQVDPTVIYGVGDAYDGDLTSAQLDTDTPYNTYTRAGLPPTPIALAGTASIRAAFAPTEDGSLYFVATGDPDGSHVFSATLAEHNAAVSRYLQRLRDSQ